MQKKARIFRDVHQSGHGSREDHREMIKMLKPKKIIPGHVPPDMTEPMVNLCTQLGYSKKDVMVMEDGQTKEV